MTESKYDALKPEEQQLIETYIKTAKIPDDRKTAIRESLAEPNNIESLIKSESWAQDVNTTSNSSSLRR